VQGPEVRSGDLAEPVDLIPGEEWTFTIKEGANGSNHTISVNYDGFVDDVAAGDVLLVDGGIMTFKLTEVTDTAAKATVRPPPENPVFFMAAVLLISCVKADAKATMP
jgi:pyruvate kinase